MATAKYFGALGLLLMVACSPKGDVDGKVSFEKQAREGNYFAAQKIFSTLDKNTGWNSADISKLYSILQNYDEKADSEIELISASQRQVLELCASGGNMELETFNVAREFNIEGLIKNAPLEAVDFLSSNVSAEKVTPRQVFQLVCRGAWTDFERLFVVEKFYEAWKAGRVIPFDRCSYVASSWALVGCQRKASYKTLLERNDLLASLIDALPKDNQYIVLSAWKNKLDYLEFGVFHFLVPEGNVDKYGQFRLELHRDKYFSELKEITQSKVPQGWCSSSDTDEYHKVSTLKLINEIETKIINDEASPNYQYPTIEEFKKSTDLWKELHSKHLMFREMFQLEISESKWEACLWQNRKNKLDSFYAELN